MQTYLDNLLASMLEENKRLATCVTTLKSLVDEAKIDCQINNTENSDNMKHSTEQLPKALRLAEKLRDAINMLECNFQEDIDTDDLSLAAMELESLHAKVQELEAKEAKSAAPVVLPEPDAYLYVNGDRHAVTLEWIPDTFLQNDTVRQSLYTGQKVRELVVGVSAPASQPLADALDAERYRWLRDKWLDNEPEAINMERAKGQRGLDAAIDAAIAAAKENK